MTSIGHMNQISISNFKAHLSATLREVRMGKKIVVIDRNIPIAEIIPYPQKKDCYSPSIKKNKTTASAYKTRLDINMTSLLIEERQREHV